MWGLQAADARAKQLAEIEAQAKQAALSLGGEEGFHVKQHVYAPSTALIVTSRANFA